MFNIQAASGVTAAVRYQQKPKCYYFDVAMGSIILTDTGGAFEFASDYGVQFGSMGVTAPRQRSSNS